MLFIQCGFDWGVTRYGPFANESIANLWLESHAPTGSYLGLHSLCDENVHRHHHKLVELIDPMRGISKRAEVDVTHTLTGE